MVAVLADHEIAAVPVVDAANQVVGVLSESDLLYKEQYHDEPTIGVQRRLHGTPKYKAAAASAREAMSAPPVVISDECTIVQAARLMHQRRVRRLPVVDHWGRLVGIITPSDLLKVFLRPDTEIGHEILVDVMQRQLQANPALVTVDVHDGVVTLSGEILEQSQIPSAIALASSVDGVISVQSHLTAATDDHRLPHTADTTNY